jgi:multidrug efflux pump subunit AcrA (membrane-fusion protein)
MKKNRDKTLFRRFRPANIRHLPLYFVGVSFLVMVLLANVGPRLNETTVVMQEPIVDLVKVESGKHRALIYTQGIMSPSNEIELATDVAGQVIDVSDKLAKGAFFKKGDLLLSIEPGNYQAEVARASAVLETARLSLTQAKSRGAKALINEANARVLASQAGLRQAQAQLEKTRVKAPFDGRVRERRVGLGQYVTPGLPIARIYSTDSAEVRLPVSDDLYFLLTLPQESRQSGEEDQGSAKDSAKDSAKVNAKESAKDSVDPGQEGVLSEAEPQQGNVILSADFGGKKFTWTGYLVRGEGAIQETSRLRYVVAEIPHPYVEDPQQPDRPVLVAGQFFNAVIEGAWMENVIKLPRHYLREGNRVLVVNSDSALELKPVSVLYRDKEHIYVDDGLMSGDQVVTTPPEIVVEGAKVKVSDTQSIQESQSIQDTQNENDDASQMSENEPNTPKSDQSEISTQ